MLNTVNLYVFACIHFREFAKNGNFAWIYIRIFYIIVSIWPYKSVFFTMYKCSRIFEKRELRENMYDAKISTFTVLVLFCCREEGGF